MESRHYNQYPAALRVDSEAFGDAQSMDCSQSGATTHLYEHTVPLVGGHEFLGAIDSAVLDLDRSRLREEQEELYRERRSMSTAGSAVGAANIAPGLSKMRHFVNILAGLGINCISPHQWWPGIEEDYAKGRVRSYDGLLGEWITKVTPWLARSMLVTGWDMPSSVADFEIGVRGVLMELEWNGWPVFGLETEITCQQQDFMLTHVPEMQGRFGCAASDGLSKFAAAFPNAVFPRKISTHSELWGVTLLDEVSRNIFVHGGNPQKIIDDLAGQMRAHMQTIACMRPVVGARFVMGMMRPLPNGGLSVGSEAFIVLAVDVDDAQARPLVVDTMWGETARQKLYSEIRNINSVSPNPEAMRRHNCLHEIIYFDRWDSCGWCGAELSHRGPLPVAADEAVIKAEMDAYKQEIVDSSDEIRCESNWDLQNAINLYEKGSITLESAIERITYLHMYYQTRINDTAVCLTRLPLTYTDIKNDAAFWLLRHGVDVREPSQ